MTTLAPDFWQNDDGAVTVDWVVLTAAIIGIGMIALYPVATGTGNMAQTVSDLIAAQPIGYDSE